jgi:hypothetical protein
MQVSATLIAAQQAAREARARLQMPQQQPAVNFAAALEKTADAGFAPLPLKQTAAPAQAATQPQAPARPGPLGQHINIVV